MYRQFLLTWSDLDGPDEDGAESQSSDDSHTSSYNDHHIVVEPHTRRTTVHGAERGRGTVSVLSHRGNRVQQYLRRIRFGDL